MLWSCVEQLFEKQTKSAGIQALPNLWDILDRGAFCLNAKASPIVAHEWEFDLSLHLSEAEGHESTKKDLPASALDQEDLLGLRGRLATIEVTREEEERWKTTWGHGAQVVVDALKSQLQVNRGNSPSCLSGRGIFPAERGVFVWGEGLIQ